MIYVTIAREGPITLASRDVAEEAVLAGYEVRELTKETWDRYVRTADAFHTAFAAVVASPLVEPRRILVPLGAEVVR